jgi:sec-independent protein translocase protein TatC
MSGRPATELTVMHHLQEVRRRLMYSVAALAIGSALGYLLRKPIIALLQHPLGQKLFYTSPMGSFDFIVRLSLLTGLLIALPVICYHLLRFVEPALPKPFRWRTITVVVVASYALALAGVAFAYTVCLPVALHFFGTVGGGDLHPLISVDRYFSFVLGYLAAFAIIFQLPLLLLFINWITPLGPKSLGKWRKWVIVIAFGIAVIIPAAADPLSQVFLAIPIVGLYELSIWIVWFVNRRRTATMATADSAPVPTTPMPVQSRPTAAPRRRPATPAAPIIDLRKHSPKPQPISPLNILDLRSNQ